MLKFEVGQRVVAMRQVTERGEPNGNPAAEFPADDYVHAEPGDEGEVIHVSEDGYPTVRFDRTGTATLVSENEVNVRQGGSDQPERRILPFLVLGTLANTEEAANHEGPWDKLDAPPACLILTYPFDVAAWGIALADAARHAARAHSQFQTVQGIKDPEELFLMQIFSAFKHEITKPTARLYNVDPLTGVRADEAPDASS